METVSPTCSLASHTGLMTQYCPTMNVMTETGFLTAAIHCTMRFYCEKVINRNLIPGKPSLASIMNLDKQMDVVAASMPENWWDTPAELSVPVQSSASSASICCMPLLARFVLSEVILALQDSIAEM